MDYALLAQDLAKQLTATETELKRLMELRTTYKQTCDAVRELPLKLSQPGLIPINEYGYMPGRLVHTNEFMVHLGDNYFAQYSSHDAQAVIARRILAIEEKMAAAEKRAVDLRIQMRRTQEERQEQLQETEEGVVDIVEPVEEEEKPAKEQLHSQPKGTDEKKADELNAFVPTVIDRNPEAKEQPKPEEKQEHKKVSKFMRDRGK